jgi:hypothetical protein
MSDIFRSGSNRAVSKFLSRPRGLSRDGLLRAIPHEARGRNAQLFASWMAESQFPNGQKKRAGIKPFW